MGMMQLACLVLPGLAGAIAFAQPGPLYIQFTPGAVKGALRHARHHALHGMRKDPGPVLQRNEELGRLCTAVDQRSILSRLSQSGGRKICESQLQRLHARFWLFQDS